MESPRSRVSGTAVRRRLLFGRGVEDRREGERAKLEREFARVEAGASGGPVFRGELEVTVLGPMGENAEQVAQVRLGVEAVQAAGRDEREQVGGALAVVVAADEEPGFSSGGDVAPKGAFAPVIVEQQAPIVEDTPEGILLTEGVAERGAKQATLIADLEVLCVGPGEEVVGVGTQMGGAQAMDLGGGPPAPSGLEVEDAPDARETFASDGALGQSRLPELTSQVCPACHLDASGV